MNKLIPRIFLFTLCLLVVSWDVSAKPPLTDDQIAQRLKNGEGAFLIRYKPYKTKKNVKIPKDKLSQKINTNEFIKMYMEPDTSSNAHSASIGVEKPAQGKKRKKVYVLPDKKDHFFVFIGSPGRHHVFPLTLFMALADHANFAFEVDLEPHKIKYLGDLITLRHAMTVFTNRGYISWDQDSQPTEMKNFMKEHYPLSVTSLVSTPLTFSKAMTFCPGWAFKKKKNCTDVGPEPTFHWWTGEYTVTYDSSPN